MSGFVHDNSKAAGYIDAHQHFWKYDPQTHAWINDDMQVIRRDFLPDDLLPILHQNGVEGCIAVQADQSHEETEFLVDLAGKHPYIKGVVGWVDLRSEKITELLSTYRQHPVIKGFRHILQGEDPSFMLHSDFLRGIKTLQKFGFTYDILIYPKHLPAALELVKQFPEQPFIIDHIAKPDIKHGLINNWEPGMRKLAACANVHCKISGMITEADWRNWTKEQLFPYLDIVVDAFGVNRLLYGSDWPVCLVAASYQQMMQPIREYFSKFTVEEQSMIFRENAMNFYHL